MKIQVYQHNDKAHVSIHDEHLSVELKLDESELEQLEFLLVDVSHAIMKFKQQKGEQNA